MNTFSWMVVFHFIGDFLLQTECEAVYKTRGRWLNRALLTHCLKYTLCFVPIAVSYRSWWWLLPMFIGHAVVDRSRFVRWWRSWVCQNSPTGIIQTPWLSTVHDQVWHLVMLAVFAALIS